MEHLKKRESYETAKYDSLNIDKETGAKLRKWAQDNHYTLLSVLKQAVLDFLEKAK